MISKKKQKKTVEFRIFQYKEILSWYEKQILI